MGTQYTLRAVPHVIDRALRRRAKQEAKSLNTVAVEARARGLELAAQPVTHTTSMPSSARGRKTRRSAAPSPTSNASPPTLGNKRRPRHHHLQPLHARRSGLRANHPQRPAHPLASRRAGGNCAPALPQAIKPRSTRPISGASSTVPASRSCCRTIRRRITTRTSTCNCVKKVPPSRQTISGSPPSSFSTISSSARPTHISAVFRKWCGAGKEDLASRRSQRPLPWKFYALPKSYTYRVFFLAPRRIHDRAARLH